MTEPRPFYHDGMRALQDRFDGRRVADALEKHRIRHDFWDADRELIESTPFFFIATSFGDYTDCSLKSGVPGFVKIVGPGTIEYPEYDGNSMYRTLGNIRQNPNVGLLFVKFDGATLRVRANGKASLHDDTDTLARHPGAKLVVRIVCEMYSNCVRSVHDLTTGTISPYMPHEGYDPPAPEWKSRDYIRDILPHNDPHREKQKLTGTFGRRTILGTGLAAAALPRRSFAQQKPIRIGVLTDMAGAYAANTGPGSVAGAQLAIDDFAKSHPGIKVELVSADLQLKPDVALGIAARWYDNEGVDLITDVPLSSAAFAIGDLAKNKDKAAIFTGGASAEITGSKCGPNHLHWCYDTWSMPHGVVDATVKEGGDTWFFITADYAFGHSLQKDAASFVVGAGGKVLGQALAPFPGTTDFSSFIVQAKSSGAKVLGMANGGADTVNCIKQASEFGLIQGGMKVAGMLMLLQDIHGIGLQAAQGVVLTEPFYWDLNDGTRAFATRYEKLRPGNMPNSVHAGQYSAVLHYLKAVAAVGADKAKASGLAVIDKMKAMPTDDPLFGKGIVRADGRKIHDMHLFQIKSPAESKKPWDYYTHKRVVPINEAFRPINQGNCPLIKA